MSPVHPGEILLEEFMKPRHMSTFSLAQSIGVPVTRLNAIIRKRRGITVTIARRLAQFFGTSIELWTNLQTFYDLEVSRRINPGLEATIQPCPKLTSCPS